MGLLSAMMAVQPELALAGPQLSGIRRADPVAPVQAVARLLGYVDSMFNFAENKRLNTLQVSMLANDIVQRYWQLKFDEVVYVLREGANGRYKTFDRIDAGVIHGWFGEYLAERDALLEIQAHNQMITEKQASELANANTVEFLNGLPQSQAQPGLNVRRAYLKKHLESYSDEELTRGVRYYSTHQQAQEAALKVELCQELLTERASRLELAQAAAKAKARELLSKFAESDAQDVDYEPLIIDTQYASDDYWTTKDVAKRPDAA